MNIPRLICKLLSLVILVSLHQAKIAQAGGVELHAHLFMKEGMGWVFRGDFFGPLQARSWHSRFSSQANPESLKKADLDIVVATLYAHPLFTMSLRDSVRRQIQLAKKFVNENPDWVLVDHPEKAKKAIAQGKHVMILALEGGSGIIETEEDMREFIDKEGIRIITFLHLTDDLFGGVAFLRGTRILSSPIAFLESIFQPRHDSEGTRLNPNGLTEDGKKMAQALVQRKVWIDLAHSSDASQKDLLPILQKANQPLLYTHTVLRKYHQAERALSDEQLKLVAQSHGYIGLMPSEEMLANTPPEMSDCETGISLLARHFKETAQVVGESSIGIGSDFNGGIPHIRPGCNLGTSLDDRGLWNIGQSHEIWTSLKKLKVWHPETLSETNTQRFLDSWSRVWSQETNQAEKLESSAADETKKKKN